MILFYIFIFFISCGLLYLSGRWLVVGLVRIAQFLEWREFVVAFFTIALAATLPNFFIGLSAIFHGIPEFSLADIWGGNVIDLTIAVALAVFVANGLPAESRMVQSSSLFTVVVAILPILLILDGFLGRGDGIILLLCFLFYVLWLFSKKERFSKKYDNDGEAVHKKFPFFIKDLGKIIISIFFLILAAEGMVRSAQFFAQRFNLSITLIGILIVGLGSALPETYFAVLSAKKKQTWMILGDLMGAVIMTPTLVLGFVALTSPFGISDFSQFAIARLFLIISAITFFIFIRSGKAITKKEAFVLLVIYVLFVFTVLLVK